jgi:predicted aldo/keto reductase-like oxidoreductase
MVIVMVQLSKTADSPIRRAFGDEPAVSLFTLGTMRALGASGEMQEVLETAIGLGINHLETAPVYGPSQRYLGKAIKQLAIKPDQVVLTSKILPGLVLAEAKQQLQCSLEQLGISRLNNLAVHGINRETHLDWALTGAGAEFLEWALAQDLVGQVGFSSHGNPELIKTAIKSKRFRFVSLHLHLFDPLRLPLAQEALSQGMGVLAISPADKGGHLYAPTLVLEQDCVPFHPLELAYRFLLAQGISSLTLGAAKPSDLEWAQRLGNAGGPLTKAEINAIKNVHQQAKQRLGGSHCGQCRDCLPCPNHVPIPEMLRLRNLALGHNMMSYAKERYAMAGNAGHWFEQNNANNCAACGDCIPRCPLNLEIPNLLAETHRLLASNPGRRLWG